MEETAAFQDATPAFSIPQKKSPKRFIYLVAVVLIIVIIFGTSRFFVGGKNQKTKPAPTPTKIEETVTPTPSEEPTPTENKTTTTTTKKINPIDQESGLDRSKLSVSVENGSGIAGAAGKVSDTLKNFGYNIVSTGNADSFDYSNVTVKLKSDSSDYLPLLKKDLSDSYTVSETSTDLDASSSADAVVIIGK